MVAANFIGVLEGVLWLAPRAAYRKLELGEMESVLGLVGLFERRRIQGRHEMERPSRFASPRA
jgi:hypothetical protein